MQRGDLAEVASICQRLLSEDPDNVEAALLYAKALAGTGKAGGAFHFLNDFVARNPDHAEAFAFLSKLSFHRRENESARQAARQAIELSPDDAALYVQFANDLLRAGFEDEATDVLSQALLSKAQNEAFLREFAAEAARGNHLTKAIEAWELVLSLRPDDKEALILLTVLNAFAGRYEEAVVAGQQAVTLAPDSAQAHVAIASAYAELERDEEARSHYRTVTELDPKESSAWGALGILEQQSGNFEVGKKLLEKAVQLQPSNGAAQHMLLRGSKATPQDKNRLAKLSGIADDSRNNLLDRAYIHYGLGKAWEDLGDYKKAMQAYDAANAEAYTHWRGGKPWQRERDGRFLENVANLFSAARIAEFQKAANPSVLPVFIVGLPRSGTTLIEQIISSHPAVCGAGELSFWPTNAAKLLPNIGETLDEPLLRQRADEYVAQLHQRDLTAARVTDKMPQNYMLLGLLTAAFPSARVIHVRRNPVDTCLSIYTNPFGQPLAFTMRKEDIALAYRQYSSVMARWREQLPSEQFIEVHYEEVVADPETAARRLIDFIDLPWDDACLKPEENTRAVKTASLWQARQPVYATSIKRSNRFAEWIPEFLALEEGPLTGKAELL